MLLLGIYRLRVIAGLAPYANSIRPRPEGSNVSANPIVCQVLHLELCHKSTRSVGTRQA